MKTLAQALMLATFSYLCRAQCIVEYTEQPPTTLDCSPYDTLHPDQQFTLRIACIGKKVGSGDSDNLDLFWYRTRSSDGVEENLGTGTESQELPNGNKRIVLKGISGLSQAPFSEEMPGDYWCQAVVTNSSGQYLLTESNVLTVLRPEDYTGKMVCNSVQSEDVTTCASVVQLSGSSASSISPPLSSLLPSLSLSASPITMTVTPSQSYKSAISPTDLSQSTQIVMSTPHTVLDHSSSTPLFVATTTSQSPFSLAPSTQSSTARDAHAPSPTSSSSSIGATADDLLPVIIAASVAGALLIMIVILMCVVVLMLCRHSRQQKASLQRGRDKLAAGGIALSSYSSDRGLRNSTSSGKWLLHSTSMDRRPSTATSPRSVTAFLPQGTMGKEECYADPENTPVVTSMFVSLSDPSEGGHHQYEYIDPKLKDDHGPTSPVYAFTDQSLSPHKQFGENGYNALTHSIGFPANQYSKLDHTLPKQNGSDTFYSSLNEGKDAFYNSLEEIEDTGCDRYANVCDPSNPNARALQVLFDDPNYSPLRSKKPQSVALDLKYTGDYERGPDYLMHKQQTSLGKEAATSPDNGDSSTNREADDYIPMSPVNTSIKPSRASAAADGRYTGEYERAPDYVPPSQAPTQKHVTPPTSGEEGNTGSEKLRDHNEYIPMSLVSSTSSTSVPSDAKYEGNYERDPNYQRNQPNSPPADYQSLAHSMMDSPHHYAHPGQM